MDYTFLLSIAIILVSTKILGLVSEKIKLPQVVGALVAGIIIGPALLNIVPDTAIIEAIAEIGVIILMFVAGLETDLDLLKEKGLSYLVIAFTGVAIPLIGGFLAYFWFFRISPGNVNGILEAIFIGVILTATSVSITVEALKELGHLSGRVGNAILGAAIIDDVMGIVVLTIVTSFKTPGVSISTILIKMAIYFLLMFIIGFIMIKYVKKHAIIIPEKEMVIFTFATVLAVSYFSEELFGIADITGAYLVGTILSQFKAKHVIEQRMNVSAFMFFSPIFFASIGLKTEFNTFSSEMITFSIILILIAILTKLVGAGLGAKICKYTNMEAFNIGVGMVSRGEVAMIVAQKGYTLGLIKTEMFSPIILIVVITTIITPIILKRSLRGLGEIPDMEKFKEKQFN